MSALTAAIAAIEANNTGTNRVRIARNECLIREARGAIARGDVLAAAECIGAVR